MKIKALNLLLLFSSLSLFAQMQDIRRGIMLNSQSKVIPNTTAVTTTNIINNAISGDLIIFPPGTYVIPVMPNTAKFGVNYYAYPGVTIILTGTEATLWSDDTVGPITNNFMGYANFVISNAVPSQCITINNITSHFTLECNRLWWASTNSIGAEGTDQSIVQRIAGKLDIVCHEEFRSEGNSCYVDFADIVDGFVNTGWSHVYAKSWSAAAQAINFTEYWSGFGRCYLEGETFTKINDRPWATTNFIKIDNGVILKANTIDLQTNATINANANNFGYSIIDARVIRRANFGLTPLVNIMAGSNVEFDNTHFKVTGGTNAVLTNFTTGMTINANATATFKGGCNFLTGVMDEGAGSLLFLNFITNAITGVGSGTILGTLDLRNKGFPDTIAMNGTILGNYTNIYGTAGTGTNVFVNVGGYSKQTLIATNTTLLIFTNASQLLSGKEITLDIYNNQSTGVVMVLASGYRLIGNTNVSMNGITNLIAAGKQSSYKISKINTNLIVFPVNQLN